MTPYEWVWVLALAFLVTGCETSTPPSAPVAVKGAPVAASLPTSFALGRSATAEEIAAWDLDVDARWNGLPNGRGTEAEGRAIFAAKCAYCHGSDGLGAKGLPGPRLIATEPRDGFHLDHKVPRSVGNYWVHPSSLFDYVRRSMPQDAPGSLTPDEVYSVVAWLFVQNGVVPSGTVLDPESIKAVAMPTRVRIVRDDREGTAEFR